VEERYAEIPSDWKALRACLRCSLVKSYTQVAHLFDYKLLILPFLVLRKWMRELSIFENAEKKRTNLCGKERVFLFLSPS
jgi:hypothetical protein